MTTVKEIINLSKLNPALAAVATGLSQAYCTAKTKCNEAEKSKKQISPKLEQVLRDNGWLDCVVWMKGPAAREAYELTFVSGMTQDKDRFASFLEARGIPRTVLEEAYAFAQQPTAGSIRVRKV